MNPGGNYVGVRLADAVDGKTTLVFAGEVQIKKGERLIVEADGGPEFAEVTTTTPVLGKACSSKKAKRLLRLASDSEYADYIERVDLQTEIQLFAEGWIEEHRLELHLAKAQVGFDRRKISLLFTSDKKVDTRDLCRAVSERFETRVDARMIGVRDETKLLGGIGSCGLTLCCSTWLKGFHPVAIKMAKMQGITPNPSKLTGHCGRLKCCVAYELEGGIEAARRLGPRGRSVRPGARAGASRPRGASSSSGRARGLLIRPSIPRRSGIRLPGTNLPRLPDP